MGSGSSDCLGPRAFRPQMSAKRENGLGDFRKAARLRRVAGGTPAVPDNHLPIPDHGANLRRYSVEIMKALTMSALTKFPLKSFSFPSQKLYHRSSKKISAESLGFLLIKILHTQKPCASLHSSSPTLATDQYEARWVVCRRCAQHTTRSLPLRKDTRVFELLTNSSPS